MTRTADQVTAGLVFLATRNFDIVRIGNRVCAALDRLDEQIAGFRVLSDTVVTLRTATYALNIEVETDHPVPTLEHPAAHYLALTLVRIDAQPIDETDLSLSIMAHALQALHKSLAPDYVQWVDPLAVLTSADFHMATTLAEEELVADLDEITTTETPIADTLPEPSRRENLPDIEETNTALLARLIEKDAQNASKGVDGALRSAFRKNPDGTPILQPGQTFDKEESALLRLSVWLFTITLGLFALPVAVALAVFNLLRGENLRLTSQTTALTGTFIALQATGSTAQAMITVQNLLG